MSEPGRDHHGGRPGGPQPVARSGLRAAAPRRSCWPSATSWTRFRRAQREPLRARAGAVLPLRDPPLPPAGQAAGAARRRARALTTATRTCCSRRFEEAIDRFLAVQRRDGPSDAISSALAAAYHRLAFQTLADQVRRSVRSVRGNQWMFRMGHPGRSPAAHPAASCCERTRRRRRIPILRERTPVRMDLTHSGWSDIFFLGMDFPEGARVLNVSIDLGVRGRDAAPAAAGRGLPAGHRRAGAAPGQRGPRRDGGHHEPGRGVRLRAGLPRPAQGGGDRRRASCRRASKARARAWPTCWRASSGPGRGLEIVSKVNDIPKGSRLAVSTNLLAGAHRRLHAGDRARPRRSPGRLSEAERRLVAARAILGEWLGGSGGGWQDSGGVWPGMKLIEGVAGRARATRSSASAAAASCRDHRILDRSDASAARRAQQLQDSLVLVHGGMAQNVGPDPRDGHREVPAALRGGVGRPAARRCGILDEILGRAAARRRPRASARATTRNFDGPIQTIIPWATQPLHRDAHRPGARPSSATASGASGCWAACRAAAWASSSSPSARPRRRTACRRS